MNCIDGVKLRQAHGPIGVTVTFTGLPIVNS